jgi:hypothetical protein
MTVCYWIRMDRIVLYTHRCGGEYGEMYVELEISPEQTCWIPLSEFIVGCESLGEL